MNYQPCPSNQPLLKDTYNFSRFKGTYFLVACLDGFDSNKEHVKKILISDATDTLKVYCRDDSCIFGSLPPESLVDIEVAIDMSGKRPYFRCKMIQNSCSSIDKFRSMYQLPIARCPYPLAMIDMLSMIEQIAIPELKTFADTVLSQSNIGLRFIQCPASLRHHHSMRGGLLLHSCEVAGKFFVDASLSKFERDLGVVSGLFHDIGKTLTLTPDGTRTDLGYLVDHHHLTLEICSPALLMLARTQKELANRLRHNWTCATKNARFGYKAKTKVARQLKIYDNESVQLGLGLNT